MFGLFFVEAHFTINPFILTFLYLPIVDRSSFSEISIHAMGKGVYPNISFPSGTSKKLFQQSGGVKLIG